MSRPFIRDAQTAQLAGVVCIVAGSLLLYDAFENRGRSRPFWSKLLPGG